MDIPAREAAIRARVRVRVKVGVMVRKGMYQVRKGLGSLCVNALWVGLWKYISP